MTLASNTSQSLRIEAADPRSDSRRRTIDLAPGSVVIRRAVAGIAMAIRLAPRDYRGVALRLTGCVDGTFSYVVDLAHRDADLAVRLAEGCDRAAIEARWREWVQFLRLPALVERIEGRLDEVMLDVTALAARRAHARRRGRATSTRRARFLTRRKVGRFLPGQALIERSELFPGSTADR